jgi:hypothetical protein
MTTNLTPYMMIWTAVALVVGLLALVRRQMAAKEDDTIHLGSAATTMASEQMTMAKKLATIDRWGKILTVLLVVTGIVLGIIYGMQLWDETSRVGLK